jgi:hypothetical protein
MYSPLILLGLMYFIFYLIVGAFAGEKSEDLRARGKYF